jgi:hypothetical protein
MPAFILLSGGILAFAVTYELLALQYHPAALVALFWSLPVSQQISWTVIGLAPIALMLFALVQHCRLIARRKAADVLETRLRGAYVWTCLKASKIRTASNEPLNT